MHILNNFMDQFGAKYMIDLYTPQNIKGSSTLLSIRIISNGLNSNNHKNNYFLLKENAIFKIHILPQNLHFSEFYIFLSKI